MNTMNFSVREFRHITGRLLHANGVDASQVNASREALLAATACGYPGLENLERALPELSLGDGSTRVDMTGHIDAASQHAIVLAPVLIDQMVVAAADGITSMRIRQLRGAELLNYLTAYAARRGLRIQVTALDEATLDVALAPEEPANFEAAAWQDGPEIAEALRSGFWVDEPRFWRMYEGSNNALTPDSELSRSHAGAQYRDADGNVVGEIDEEAYLYIKSAATEVIL